MFIRFDPASAPWRAINSTYGVARLVTFEGHRPQTVPTALVEALQARCDEDGVLVPPEALEPGTAVQLTTGPFAQFVATVHSVAQTSASG